MRMIVMFDLPTGNKAERRSYTEFRKFLINDGYHMEQFSVYSRVLLSRDSVDTHTRRIQANLPSAGAVVVFTMTEKQYADRKILIDTRSQDSRIKGPDPQLTLAF